MTSVKAALSTPLAAASRIDELTDRLVTAIAIGEYLPGAKLPSERDLAASLRVGRMTVRAAIARLVDRGLLETQRGRGGGSFVTEQWSATSSASVQRTLSAKWSSLRDTCEAVSRLHGTISRAAAENRDDADVERLRARLADFRAAESGRESQRARWCVAQRHPHGGAAGARVGREHRRTRSPLGRSRGHARDGGASPRRPRTARRGHLPEAGG
jgi:DNA-binding FadR family transcriptional regulator